MAEEYTADPSDGFRVEGFDSVEAAKEWFRQQPCKIRDGGEICCGGRIVLERRSGRWKKPLRETGVWMHT